MKVASMRIQLAVLGLALSATGVNAQAYVQCSAGTLLLLVLDLVGGTVGNLLSGIHSNSACISACKTAGWAYSFYTPGVLDIIAEACYCTSTAEPPQAEYIDSASTSAGACSLFDFSTTILNTNFVFQQCYTTITPTGGGVSFTTSDPGVCFSTCASYPYLSLTPVWTTGFLGATTTNQYNCQCGTTGTVGSAAICGNNIPTLYKLSTASGTRKKRDRVLEQIEAKKRTTFCPDGMTACGIPGSDRSYECIDPASELESCGGCTNGFYGSEGGAYSNETVGVDCTQMQGVAMGAVSCVQGQCQVSNCRPKWKLQDGRCVRSSDIRADRFLVQ